MVEIGARRGQTRALANRLSAQGMPLPDCGRVAPAADQLILGVRPGRWMPLSPVAQPGATVGLWRSAIAGLGSAVDLSSGLAALHLQGPATTAVLAQSCRLDLTGEAFAPGRAAATILAQVPATLAALPSGLLLLTPVTTARHLYEWLLHAARGFRVEQRADLTLNDILRRENP